MTYSVNPSGHASVPNGFSTPSMSTSRIGRRACVTRTRVRKGSRPGAAQWWDSCAHPGRTLVPPLPRFSDVPGERGEVEVTAATGGRVLPHVLDLAVLVVAVVAELATDARLLVATERLRRRDHVVVVDPH